MTIETDTCIVGGGPAGLVVAHALATSGVNVVLIESGGDVSHPEMSALNDGNVVGGPYAPLTESRARQVGGTTGIWNTPVCGENGAKYVPLDPTDFERVQRDDGWPFGREVLLPYYERAQRVCGIGLFAYDAEAWAIPGVNSSIVKSGLIVPRVYQLGTRTALVSPLVSGIDAASNARLLRRSTVLRLESDTRRDEISHALVASHTGDRWAIHARRFVLAAGAIENARLLLASGRESEGMGNESGMVGRCFMEHPRDRALLLAPSTPSWYRDASFFDVRAAPPGEMRPRFEILGRLALSAEVIRRERMLNASATLLPIVRPWVGRARSWLPISPSQLSWLPPGGHGWSRHAQPQRVFEGIRVLLNLEQRPLPHNRIVLGTRRDRFGVPLPELHWGLTAEEHQEIDRVRVLFARELEQAGVGKILIDRNGSVNPNAHHHAGTTRMHENPRHGVVDAFGRVHTISNLFVAGASVFPTAGFANPVLTTIALSLRLADHLASAS